MSGDDYLWDPSTAPPEPDVRRLEQALAPHAWRPAPSPVDAPASGADVPRTASLVPSTRPPRLWAALPAAVAAGRDVVLVARGPVESPGRPVPTSAARWRVDGIAGVRAAGVGDRLVVGAAAAALTVGTIGDVTLEPGARVRVEDTGADAHRLFLEAGALEARIWAAPRVFQVGTPAGLTVDLGCVYRIEVDPEGRSHCAVRTGRVAFETGGRRVTVPAGAACVAVPGRGPSAPLWADAPAALAAAVAAVEFASSPDAAVLAAGCAAARPADALTLWHLCAAVAPAVRRAAAERLAALAPPPPGVTLDAVCGGDAAARAAWWDALAAGW